MSGWGCLTGCFKNGQNAIEANRELKCFECKYWTNVGCNFPTLCDSCGWLRKGKEERKATWMFRLGEATSFHCSQCRKLIVQKERKEKTYNIEGSENWRWEKLRGK